ncbi:hypothetical protein ACFL09_01100 [Planctomycetota bacterium]
MREKKEEEELVEPPGGPDEGLPIRKSVRNRLLRQKQAVAEGERGDDLDELAERMGLK